MFSLPKVGILICFKHSHFHHYGCMAALPRAWVTSPCFFFEKTHLKPDTIWGSPGLFESYFKDSLVRYAMYLSIFSPWAGSGFIFLSILSPWAGSGFIFLSILSPWAGSGFSFLSILSPWAGRGIVFLSILSPRRVEAAFSYHLLRVQNGGGPAGHQKSSESY